MKAIVNGKIILKDRIQEDCALLYSNVIEGIVPQDNVPSGAEVIDAKGGYVSPGLIDLHIHGYLGKDVCDGEEESIRTISEGIVKNGVTGVMVDFSKEEYNGVFPFTTPVILKGEIRNTTGIVTIEARAEFSMEVTCDRCAEDIKPGFTVDVIHDLVASLNHEDNDDYILVEDMKLDVEQLT